MTFLVSNKCAAAGLFVVDIGIFLQRVRTRPHVKPGFASKSEFLQQAAPINSRHLNTGIF